MVQVYRRRWTSIHKYVFTGSRESRGSRDSNSIEVLSAPTSPSEQENSMNSQIGRNTLRSSKSNFYSHKWIFPFISCIDFLLAYLLIWFYFIQIDLSLVLFNNDELLLFCFGWFTGFYERCSYKERIHANISNFWKLYNNKRVWLRLGLVLAYWLNFRNNISLEWNRPIDISITKNLIKFIRNRNIELENHLSYEWLRSVLHGC